MIIRIAIEVGSIGSRRDARVVVWKKPVSTGVPKDQIKITPQWVRWNDFGSLGFDHLVGGG